MLEGASTNGLPQDALQGMNDWRRLSYGGPCPPVGRHRYFFKLYALDTVFANLHRPTKMKLENAMKSHIIAQTQLIGMYQKQR
jgi:Raf kinase inhibitor-like YbhB/YbcL family protein